VDRGEHAGADQEGAEQRSEKVRMASRMVQTLQRVALLHDDGGMQQRRAASQGMKEAFSTGSQNQKPPQPSS
jgi:hypothetical protein